MTAFVTVRQVFERAYGPLPEGATCHCAPIWSSGSKCSSLYEAVKSNQCYLRCPESGEWIGEDSWGHRIDGIGELCPDFIESPDISDRPASAFCGFFGEAYDNAVRELEAGE